MAHRSRGGSTPFAWTTVFYLLLIFVAPLAFLQTANAQDEAQKPIREDLGDGNASIGETRVGTWLMKLQSSVSILEPPIRKIGAYSAGETGADRCTRCVGVMQNGKVEILVNDQGNRITPSYVAFTDEERLVGDAAKNQYAANPQRTIYDVK